MKLIQIIASATAALAAATPEAVPQAGTSKPLRFSGISLRSASPIHFGSINANGGKFWIGKQTETSCPEDTLAVADSCKHANKNQTIFGYLDGQSTLSLDVNVERGQKVYVNEDTGRLRFTIAHSANMVGNPVQDGFTIVYDANVQFQKNDWIACEEGPMGTYGVYAAAHKKGGPKCLGFTWKVEKVDDSVPSAWQYD